MKNLRKLDVDLQRMQIRIRNLKTETSSEDAWRIIGIHPVILSYVSKQIIEGDEYVYPICSKHTKNWARRCVKRACRDLEIPYKRLHGLRHTFISNLSKAGVPVYEIMKLVGHTRLETTQLYLHADEQRISEQVRKLEY